MQLLIERATLTEQVPIDGERLEIICLGLLHVTGDHGQIGQVVQNDRDIFFLAQPFVDSQGNLIVRFGFVVFSKLLQRAGKRVLCSTARYRPSCRELYKGIAAR